MIILPLVIGGMAISERMYLNYIALVLGIGPLICQCLVLVYPLRYSTTSKEISYLTLKTRTVFQKMSVGYLEK